MLELRKMVVSLEPADLLALERIVVDEDAAEALAYLKKTIYNRLLQEQKGRLKSHLDGGRAAEGFANANR